MPSPIGHALAGLIVGLAGAPSPAPGRLAQSEPGFRRAVLVCMGLAVMPDLDYVYLPIHRGPSHSIGAVVLVTLVAAAVTRWSTGHTHWRLAMVCGLAYFSHLVMDWLGRDPTLTPGLQALWPLSDRLFISGWDVFRSTERVAPFVQPQLAHNVWTLAQEVLLLGPVAAWLLWRRR